MRLIVANPGRSLILQITEGETEALREALESLLSAFIEEEPSHTASEPKCAVLEDLLSELGLVRVDFHAAAEPAGKGA